MYLVQCKHAWCPQIQGQILKKELQLVVSHVGDGAEPGFLQEQQVFLPKSHFQPLRFIFMCVYLSVWLHAN